MADISTISTEELLKMKQPIKDMPTDQLLKMRQQPATILAEPVRPEEQDWARQQEWAKERIAAGEIEEVPPTFWERFRKDIPQMAGGTVGGIAGAKAGAIAGAKIPTGHPILKGAAVVGGFTLGAGIGGMGGKGYQQYYRMTRPGAKPMTLGDIYTEQIIAGLEEAGSELAGRGIAKVGTKVFSKLASPLVRKTIEPGAREASELLLKHGTKPTLAQITQNRLIDIMEAVAEGSFVGGGKIQKLKTIAQPQALKRAVSSLSDDFSRAIGRKLAPEEVGDIVIDAINQKNTAFRQASRSIYNQVDKLLKRSGQTGKIVDISPLKKFAQQRMSSRIAINKSVMGDTLLDNVMKLPDNLTFKQATSLRSSLLTQTRTMSATKDVALGVSKQLSKMTDTAIEGAGKSLSGDAYDMWRFANKFHREGKTVFNSKIIKSLSRTLIDNPEKVIPRIFQPNASRQIRVLKETVDKKAWDSLKHGYVEHIINRSTRDGKFVGSAFLSELDKLGESALTTTFDVSELNSLRMVGEAAKLIHRPTQEFAATGRMLIALTQAGALYQLGTLKGSAFIVTPYAFARIVTNPRWAKMLVQGLKAPEKSAALLARLGREVRELEQERRGAEQQKKKKAQLSFIRRALTPF